MAVCKYSRSVCVSVLLFLMIPFASPLYFKLSTIGPDDANRHIKTTGDAYISPQGIQVTTDESNRAYGGKTGRATYIEPFHLWDKATGNMADFYTHFRFVIDSSNSNCHADGLAFFLAPVDSTIPGNSSGSGLGLAYFDAAVNISGDPFVAVEFDTYTNGWDPYGPHVGIDINSLISATELVSFGFSAATGDCFEKNNVKSWEFNSSLEIVSNSSGPADPPTATNINPNPSSAVNNGGKKTKMGLVIGFIVGLSVLILSLVLTGYSLWRKRNREGEKDEVSFDKTMDTEFETGCGPKKFSYGELVRATDYFADKKKLGEGGFGGVYQGFLRDLNSHIAVKRVSKDSKQGHREYA